MTNKTPLKATYTGSNPTGLAEFISSDTIGITDGGTGSNTVSGAKTNLSLNNVENTALSTWTGTTNIDTAGDLVATSLNNTPIGFATLGADDAQFLDVNTDTFSINTSGTAADWSVSNLTSGRVVVAGTGGHVEDSASLTWNGTDLGVTGSIDIDNINLDGNIISTTNTNGDLTFTPNGTGKVIVSGDLQVDGTTSTVNSTVVTIDDPIFTLGGDTAPASDDNKDRGIEYKWHDGSNAKIGFFGFDDSTGRFTFIPDATNTTEVFSGTKGAIDVTDIYGTLQTASQTNITAIGTITTGTWNGTAISDAYIDNNINATHMADGSVTNTEFQYINSLTSNAQTQINAKADTTHTHTEYEGIGLSAAMSLALGG